MLMLILIDDDFSHLYISIKQIKSVFIVFSLSINDKSKMATTDKQKLGFCYIITNN